MLSFSCQIDAYRVLGVTDGASLQEIRDAYRSKARKYHPDTGGDDWAFRVLSQAYEMLSTARVAQKTRAEVEPRAWTPRRPRAGTETFRAAPQTPPDPIQVVSIEKLWVRYEAEQVWLLQSGTRDDRFLSCSLHLTWPDAAPSLAVPEGPRTEQILHALGEVFDEMCTLTRVVSSRCTVEERRLSAWLSYPSTDRACAAIRLLQGMLNGRGFDVRQWNRDLLIPRDAR